MNILIREYRETDLAGMTEIWNEVVRDGVAFPQRLVRDCLEQGKLHGFKILQFNAVVRTNIAARRLYEKLGFTQLGVMPKGFLMKDGHYEDICPYYHEL